MNPTYEQKPIFQNVYQINGKLYINMEIYFTKAEAVENGQIMLGYAFTTSTDVTVYNVEEVEELVK